MNNLHLTIFSWLMTVFVASDQLPQSQPGFAVLFPSEKKLLVSVSAASITGAFDTLSVALVELMEKVEQSKYIEVSTKEQKENFAKQVRGMFSNQFLLERVSVKLSRIRSEASSLEHRFSLAEEMGLRKFWNSTAFREILAAVYDNKVLGSEVILQGWSKKSTPVAGQRYREKFKDTFAFSVFLAPGLNTFYLRALSPDGKIVAFDSVTFFYKTQVQSDGPSPDLVHTPFHTEENEGKCSSCHPLSLSASVKEQKSTVEAECKTCHGALVSQKSSHVPASNWDCLMCHDPGSAPKYQLYSDKKYDASLCYECHADKQEAQSKPTVHLVSEDCTACHDVHGSRNDALVVDRVNTVCSSCHPDAAKTPHPVINHPLEGRPDPLHEGKELSCATCHNPHASDHPRLLNMPQFSLCQACHKK